MLPLTVIDQIRLWEMERNRLKPTPCKYFCEWLDGCTHSGILAYLYHEFNVQADFDAAEKYAKDLGVLLWSSTQKRTMIISEA